ncbi:MAG: HAD hydrolase family protein, partial [Candidatus Hydrothermarchaeota archaeon]|nr:HAD hydrolase family protein [Candidatus Hydrothermarchaeota archaeon]
MAIRAVAIDIDGTLTDENSRLNLGAVGKIREIEAHNIPVILATGNILCRSEAASIFIGTSGILIAENGGIIKFKSQAAKYLGNVKEVERAYDYLSKHMEVEKVARSELRRT